jgi:hypothetical protein
LGTEDDLAFLRFPTDGGHPEKSEDMVLAK